MKKLFFASIIALAFMLQGCASSPITGLFTSVKHPGTGSIGVVDNSVSAQKTGKSSCYSVLCLFAFGDCSVEAAQKQGGISKVNSVDQASTNIFYFYGKYTTIVRGE